MRNGLWTYGYMDPGQSPLLPVVELKTQRSEKQPIKHFQLEYAAPPSGTSTSRKKYSSLKNYKMHAIATDKALFSFEKC